MGKENDHIGDPLEHTGLFFRKAAYSKHDVPSKLFHTNYFTVLINCPRYDTKLVLPQLK
jgi:hypothetical protein